jgi:acyl CoA:acetate/3-ketoacid CoA transferase alpha subunit
MSLVKGILRAGVRGLTIVSFGGPDVGVLCAAGRVRRVVYGFVSLDSVVYDPWFRRVREAGEVEVMELDEGMLAAGLRAAGQRLPFLPIRAGVGSDVLRVNPGLKTVISPYDDQEVVAMPALHLDVALVHLNRADRFGNAQYLGVDPYFDDLFCMAAGKRFVSCERVVGTEELTGPVQSLLLNRMMVDGVVEAPDGAHFTSCAPDYERDEGFQRRYVEAANDEGTWAGFLDDWLSR